MDDTELKNLRILPIQPDFAFVHFKPGNITQYIQDNFGMFPNLQPKQATRVLMNDRNPRVS